MQVKHNITYLGGRQPNSLKVNANITFMWCNVLQRTRSWRLRGTGSTTPLIS
jgi:hypothetical protein